MHIFLTALTGFFALLSTFCVYACYRHVERANDAQIACARAAGKLNQLAGRVIAAEGALETLQAQHRKLSGKFYAAKVSETPPSADVGPAPAGLRTPAPPSYCDNFNRAQLEGPMSPAASCECDYCVEMRQRRRKEKAALMPAAKAATLGASRSRE